MQAASSPTHLFVAGGERLGSPMTVIGSAEAIAGMAVNTGTVQIYSFAP